MVKIKKALVYIAVYAVAIGLGSVLASIFSEVDGLSWLAIQPSFGFEPFKLNLIVLDVTFGMNVHICVAHIIMIIIAIFVAPKVTAALVKG